MKTTSHVYQRNPNTVVSLNKKDHGVKIQQSLGRWSNAKNFQYQLQHKREDHSPHCIYAMVHHTTDPASKVTLEMFTHHSGERAWKLTSTKNLIPTASPFPVTYEAIAKKFDEAIYLYSSVVPSVLVTDLKRDVNSQLSQLKLKQDSDKAIQDTIDFCYNMLGKLNEIDFIYQKNINKEVQRNDICYQHIKESLDRLGFISKTSIDHCDICKFGKSLMDLYFYKDCGATVNSAIIKKLEEDDYGDFTEYNYAQIFADMVRVGSLLARDALVRGTIIDKIMVFGLLTNYTTKTCTVTKYYVDFIKEETIIYVGEEINAVKGFVGIVQAMNNL